MRLLETSTLNLPTSSPQSTVASGFVHKARSRACPDCLANGRISSTCETCFGRGHIDPVYAKNVASTDALPDDDDRHDPYSVSKDKKTPAYGLDGSRHDATYARDREIENLARQTRPARKEAELLDEANAEPYAWERAREQMRKRFDYDALDIALELLRQHDPVAYRALHAVFVYEWMPFEGMAAAVCRRGLRFLSPRLAAVELARGKALRAPDMEPETRVGYGPLRPEAGSSTKALRDAAMRRAADEGASVAQLMERFRVSKSTIYSVVNQRDAA